MGMFELGPPNDIVASAPWDDAAANAPPGEVVKREFTEWIWIGDDDEEAA